MPLPNAPDEYDRQRVQQILSQIDRRLARLEAAMAIGYQVSNVTATRTLDADSTTLAEIADVLGTLIDDMKTARRLG